MLENLDLVETNGCLSLVKRVRESNFESDWYDILLVYFQSDKRKIQASFMQWKFWMVEA